MCQHNRYYISEKVFKKLSKTGEAVFWKLIKYNKDKKRWTGPFYEGYRYKPYKNTMHRLDKRAYYVQRYKDNKDYIFLNERQDYGIHVFLTRAEARKWILGKSNFFKIIPVIGKLDDFVSAGVFSDDSVTRTAVFRTIYLRKEAIKVLNTTPK